MILQNVNTLLVIDWPSKDVPEPLALAGFQVHVRGGPAERTISVYELQGGRIVERRVGRPPDDAELVYSYRPLSALPQIIAMAKALHAETIWTQSVLLAANVKDPKVAGFHKASWN